MTWKRDDDRLLNARELAERWGVHVEVIRDHYQRGELPGFSLYGRKGAPIRFRLSDIEALEEEWSRQRDAAA